MSIQIDRKMAKDDLIVIGGAGGFIGGSLARYFHDLGYTKIRAIDRKPLPDWYQRVPGVECICADLGICGTARPERGRDSHQESVQH